MSKKTIINIATILLIAITLIAILPSFAMADIDPNDYKPGAISNTDVEPITNIANPIIGIIKVVGAIVLVAVLMIMGIKYILGSAEEKAEYKKTMIPYLIGTFLLVGLTEVIAFIIDIASIIK